MAPAGAASTGLDLRVIDRDGEPWFVAKDLCDALGMDTSKGVSHWLAGLDLDERDMAYQRDFCGLPNRGARIVSESGMYAIVLKSRKAEAKAFRKWVTSEVLPTIRKTGGYMAPSVANLAETDPLGITHAFTFRADGWFNMTKAAQAFDKNLSHFWQSPDTAAYIQALKESGAKGTESVEYVIANRGRHGGTWAHPKLALRFAQWLDVRFAVWCEAAHVEGPKVDPRVCRGGVYRCSGRQGQQAATPPQA